MKNYFLLNGLLVLAVIVCNLGCKKAMTSDSVTSNTRPGSYSGNSADSETPSETNSPLPKTLIYSYPKINPSLSGNTPTNTSLRCLKAFVSIDENKISELTTHLSANLDCLDSADFSGRNLITFALESNNVPAMTALLSISGDKKQKLRFYQKDSRGNSLFTFAKSNPTYHSLLNFALGLGMRTESGQKNENLADLAWSIKAGDVLADLVVNYKLMANNKGRTIDEYLVTAAREFQVKFVAQYADLAGMSLKKLFNNNGNQNTLLEISAQMITKDFFTLEMHELYLDRDLLVENDKFDSGPFARLDFIRKDAKPENYKKLDEFFLKLAMKYPKAWENLFNHSQGDDWIVTPLIKSIYLNSTLDVATVTPVLIPIATPATIWELKDPKFVSDHPDVYKNILGMLVGRGRFPSEQVLQSKIDTIDAYLAGVYKKVYTPNCSYLRNMYWSVKIEVLDQLIKLGMDPKSCDGVDRTSYEFNKNGGRYTRAPEIEFYFSKLAGRVSVEALEAHKSLLNSRDYFYLKNFLDTLINYGFEKEAIAFIKRSDVSDVLFSSWSDAYDKLFPILEEYKLKEHFQSWIKSGNRMQYFCGNIAHKNKAPSFAKITEAFEFVQSDAKSCYRHAIETNWGSYGNDPDLFSALLESDPKLARETIAEFALAEKVCPALGRYYSEYSQYISANDCWNGLIKSFKSSYSNRLNNKNYVTYIDSLLSLSISHPELLTPILQDPAQLNEICMGNEKEDDSTKRIPYIIPLIEHGGPAGTFCLKALYKPRNTYVRQFLDDESRVYSYFRRNINFEEFKFLLLEDWSSHRQTYYTYYHSKSAQRYLGDIDETQIRETVKQNFTNLQKYSVPFSCLQILDSKEIDVGRVLYTHSCGYEPSGHLNILNVFWDYIESINLNTEGAQSRVRSWLEILEDEAQKANFDKGTMASINVFVTSMNYAIKRQVKKWPDVDNSFKIITKDHGRKMYCRTLLLTKTESNKEKVDWLREYFGKFSPEDCK